MGSFLEGYWDGDPTAYYRQERQSGTYSRYIPNKLSELEFQPDQELSLAVEDALVALAEAGTTLHFTARSEMIGLAVMRSEAVASSFIEGVSVSPAQLLRIEHLRELNHTQLAQHNAEYEVLGNLDALNVASAQSKPGQPITLEHILEVHRALMRYTQYAASAGALRKSQSWIGGLSPLHASYVGPPAEMVPELIADLLEFINSRKHSALITAAIAHAQFEMIHPFGDGNGRTGRALVHLILQQRSVGGEVLIPLSRVLREDNKSYIFQLQQTHPAVGDPNWNEWCLYFTRVLEQAANRTMSCDARLQLLFDEWTNALQGTRSDSAVWKVLPILLGHPVVTSTWLQHRLNCTAMTADNALEQLTRAGIIRQVSAGKRNRVFEASEVLKELDRL